MKYRIIFSDYDDTITSSASVVSQRTRNAINRYISLGGTFVVSTGRSFRSISRQLETLLNSPEHGYVITLQGGQVYKDGELVYNKTLDNVQLARYIGEERRQGLNCQVYCGSDMYTSVYDDNSKVYEDLTGCKLSIVENLEEFVRSSGLKFNKLLTFVDPKTAIATETEIKKRFPMFKLVLSRPRYLETIPADSGKDSAVKYVAGMLGINMDETVCIGDGENDADMISAGGLKAAVGNANAAAKASAKIITPSNDEDGLAWLIEKIINGEEICC